MEFGNFQVLNREEIILNGIEAVLVFGDSEAVFRTAGGSLVVCGFGFTMSDFDSREKSVTVKGRIDAVFYPGKKAEKKGFIKRLFS